MHPQSYTRTRALGPSLGLITLLAIACGPAQQSTSSAQTASPRALSVLVPQTPLDGNSIPKFVDPVPTFDGTPRQRNADRQREHGRVPAEGAARLRLRRAARALQQWHDPLGILINGTPASWPTRTIEARRGISTSAIYRNSLVNTKLAKLLTIDQTIHWADPLGTTGQRLHQRLPAGPGLPAAVPGGPIPAVVHLHGAEDLSAYDGHPDAWFTPAPARRGPGFFTRTYNYVNNQEATTLWFHDHALGIVRLNVYAGLAGFYLIRDNRDTGLASNPDHPPLRRPGAGADDRRTGSSTPTASSSFPTARPPTTPPA